jgi:hypothetical protein
VKPVTIACLSIFALSAVAACSGGGSVPPTAGASSAGSASAPDRAKRRKGHARIRIRIPHKKKHGRHGRYISPATKSISIVVAGTTTVVANLTPSSPNCSLVGTFTQCTVNVTSQVGAVDFSFTTYDDVGATGNKLSANDVTLNVVSGATTPLNVTLGGIASSISFVPTVTVPQITGSQAAGYNLYGKIGRSFTVVPLDADGNTIIGAGAPTVTVTAPSGQHITLFTPAPATPNEWLVGSSYTAANPLTPANATVTAVATPVPGSGGATVSAPVSIAQYEPWIYVTDEEEGSLYVFDEEGNQITLGSNAWLGIPSPEGISFDPHNDQLYMAGVGDNVVYQTDVVGNLVAAAPGAWSPMSSPGTARYVPTNNEIYVPNQSSLPGTPSPNPAGVTAYDETGAAQTVSGSMSSRYGTDLAFNSANGLLYLAGGGLSVPAVLAYDLNGNPQTVSGNYGGLVQADSLGYDAHNGFLYVGSKPASSITVYDAQGNAQSTTGTFPGLTQPSGIVYDPYSGLIYVADSGTGNGGSNVFAFDEQGNAQPITFFNVGFEEAWGITVVP